MKHESCIDRPLQYSLVVIYVTPSGEEGYIAASRVVDRASELAQDEETTRCSDRDRKDNREGADESHPILNKWAEEYHGYAVMQDIQARSVSQNAEAEEVAQV